MAESPHAVLAEQLCRIRDLSGRSLRALARDTGTSSSSLSRYFTGQLVPPWDVVVTLCRLVRRDPRPLRALWEKASSERPWPAPSTERARNDLPFDMLDFTGREAELAAVLAAVRDTRAVAIDGMPGVGKTCLAVHAAHLLGAEYPDGQFYLDLHGFTPGREPLDSQAALAELLDGLGVTHPPSTPSQRAARWRSELAGRRAVVVLDNALDAEQVRPLLPGAGTAVVIITSRNRLVELDGAPPVSLDVLAEAEAAQLFGRASGNDLSETESVARVLRQCGGLPLAIRVAGARLRHRPGWTVGILAERLGEGSTHFDTAFAMSVRQLDSGQRRMFRALGLLPAVEFGAEVAAAVGDVRVSEARSILEDLVDAHLVQEPAADRYRLHDLVREHAHRLAAAEETEPQRRAGLSRVFEHYLDAATAADRALPFLHRSTRGDAPTAEEQAAALAWFDRECDNLLAVFDKAVEVGADEHVSRLPQVMRAYYFRRRGTADENRLLEQALAAATRLDDRRLLAELHSDLGFARYTAGRIAEAESSYDAAAGYLFLLDDPELEGSLALRRGYLQQDRGLLPEALTLFKVAADGFERAGYAAGLAQALGFQGWLALQLADSAEASRLATAALDRNPPGAPPQIVALVTLGVAIARDDADASLAHLHKALALAREDDHLHNQVWCLSYLGVALREMGRLDDALAHHRQAFALLEDLAEDQWEIDHLNAYAETCRAAGLTGDALHLYRRALSLAQSLHRPHEESLARKGLAKLGHPAP